MSDLSIKPGIRLGHYPQRINPATDEIEQWISHWVERLRCRLQRRRYSQSYIVRRVKAYDEALQNSTDEALDLVLEELRLQLRRKGLQEPLIIESFAVIRELAARTLGKRHFDTQLYGGWLMMNGMLAEMHTGEGKTLTTTLPACTAALAGVPVHVITANDYLAERDCEIMLPLYQRLRLKGTSVLDGMDPQQCRQAYRADIVHLTNKQVAFDYLRDRIEMGDDTGELRSQYRQIQRDKSPTGNEQLLLRGLCFAIVDEADSVLIDEANTPLIITRTLPNEESADTYSDALYLASTLIEDQHYKVDSKSRLVELTLAGEDSLEDQVLNLPKLWRNKRKRETLLRQALSASLFYQRDREYVVSEEKVQIIDQSTGRLMPDRAWEQGLHQMIEAKEGCVISEQREPQARISYQKFFSRYLRLAGTSGTISEVAGEMQRVYGLEVFKVSTNQPNKRLMNGEKIYRDALEKKLALINRVKALHRLGRPILIGTCSVEESERVGEWLQMAAISHRVLNAKQDRDEAEIIAAAGQAGAITVATNMAGRGTDIALGEGVEALGGLHVISLSLNDSYRIDRQLYGRCARQGDPGSAEAILSLEDTALTQYFGPLMHRFLASLSADGKPVPETISRFILRLPQRNHEKKQCRIRKTLMKQDQRLRRTLAFAGRFE
ncbi:MAG: prepilin peptidase [Gammaproteobacteria bacterium]|nr:prepilin peptidase [Gammaproteobacteria bacterium]